MIISPGRGYVFVHIPKTGGTSMAAALEARAHRDDILIGDTEKARRRRGRVAKLRAQAAGRLWKHSTLADVDGVVTAEALDRMLCFCLVRNPWDRVVSYYHWLRGQSFDHAAVRIAKAVEFAAFLRHPHTQESLRAWPYGRYMRDASGRERGLFLRLEHLTEDWGPLVDHLGFTPGIGHENRSDRAADWRGYYDDETRAIVADICAEDVVRFGYRF
ncbi:sulfotransferase family 2 domain-containing protein [Ponticoccus alexandrii]|uniref:Sulfotransferase family 2 domain-containing protein n=1 Tax=Ponticoccus alexandrii TaxID=1943633 RepID=A0ABX7F7D0_9RHOB|nr:sulfotransferase family 2 domain-containing protein [Ponticoccus alexandrii]ETA49235.1 Type II secretory pathway, pullulanase PulA [Rhodobacteraceae bacterium PD-2]QRF65277.1 sulfotransferase family 2 domain-containing protein [Ponticoccus alexandrii]